MSESFWGGFLAAIGCMAILVCVGFCASTPSVAEVNNQNAVCRQQLHTATASDSLRIYRLQPKCLP